MWARGQHQLVALAAEFADSDEWVVAGSPTAAHFLAGVADVEICTAREWIRIGRRLRELHASADAFAAGRISYSKVRTLTRLATADNEEELLAIAEGVPAGALGRALAGWVRDNSDPDELAAHQARRRGVRWRTEPDGMVTLNLRLQPLVGGTLVAVLTSLVRRCRPPAGERPTLAQQYADAVAELLEGGVGSVATEVVVHVRGDGCSLDDGTPIAGSVVERIAPASYLRALIHDADGRPINASGRRRHPSVRQKRVVKERDRACVDCGSTDLLEYDHDPPYHQSGRTTAEELEPRCPPCHRARHRG